MCLRDHAACTLPWYCVAEITPHVPLRVLVRLTLLVEVLLHSQWKSCTFACEITLTVAFLYTCEKYTYNGILIRLPVRPHSQWHSNSVAYETKLPMESLYDYLWDHTPNGIYIRLPVRPHSQWNPYMIACETKLPTAFMYDCLWDPNPNGSLYFCLWGHTPNGIDIRLPVRPHSQYNLYRIVCETKLPMESLYFYLWDHTPSGIHIRLPVIPHSQWNLNTCVCETTSPVTLLCHAHSIFLHVCFSNLTPSVYFLTYTCLHWAYNENCSCMLVFLRAVKASV